MYAAKKEHKKGSGIFKLIINLKGTKHKDVLQEVDVIVEKFLRDKGFKLSHQRLIL